MKKLEKEAKMILLRAFVALLLCNIMMMQDQRNVLQAKADNSTPTTASSISQRDKIVNYALSQVGTQERTAREDCKYTDWWGQRVQWCHVFVSYCANQCGIGTDVIPKTASCNEGAKWFKARGLFKNRSYTPQKGDIIYILTDASKKDGLPHHVGIVYEVSGGYVRYVDGNNTSTRLHGVAKSSRKLGDSSIYGYGTPKYKEDPIPDEHIIYDVKITDIDSQKITVAWKTKNLNMSFVQVMDGSKIWKSERKNGNTYSVTFKRSYINGCSTRVQVYIYAYENNSGGSETLHKVTYGKTPEWVEFPEPLVLPVKWNIENNPGEVVTAESINGWVISDPSNPITSVQVVINGVERECSRYNRPDVVNAYPQYQRDLQGFSFTINPMYCENGDNTLEVRYTLKDGKKGTILNRNLKAIKMPEQLFDSAFYYMCYSESIPEVKAIGRDHDKLLSYYYMYGINSGQRPCMMFYPDFYKQKNADLSNKNYRELYIHFVQYCIGNNEPRETSEFMNLAIYKECNTDLKALNMTTAQLLSHARSYGYFEHRYTTDTVYLQRFYELINVQQYAAAYDDLYNAYGDGKDYYSAQKLLNHFFEYNLPNKELRRSSEATDMRAFVQKNALENCSGNDIFWMYILNGNTTFNKSNVNIISALGKDADIKGTWKKDSKGWWYQYDDKTYPKNQWSKIGGKWYHFDQKGYMQTGWYQEGNCYYFLKSNGQMAVNEWVQDKYYFDLNGCWVKEAIKS